MCNSNGQFLHLLLFVPHCPIPLMGRDLLTKLEATVSRGGRQGKGTERTRWLDDITASMNMSLSKLQEKVEDSEA